MVTCDPPKPSILPPGIEVHPSKTCLLSPLLRPFLKDTISNCQRPVFPLGVSQHNMKILNWSSKLRDNNGRKKHFHTKLCAFRCLISGPQQSLILRSRNKIQILLLMKNYLFLENCVSSEGAVSHNVLYYQQLSVVTK